MAPNRPLTSFRLFSFDIYGTLIDWESGIQNGLKPLAARLDASNPLPSNLETVSVALGNNQRAIQAKNPDMKYDLVLKNSYEETAREFGALPLATDPSQDVDALLDTEGTAFAATIAQWPAFPDTVAAMRKLKRYGYKLVPLSNVDNYSFNKSLQGPLAGLHDGGVASDETPFFDAVYTAQDIGSYKPDLRNFHYLIEHARTDFGLEKDDILHVAHSLFHDHQSAKQMGLHSAWISRGDDGKSAEVAELLGKDGSEPKVAIGWKFDDLAGLAEAIEREKAEQKNE